MNGGGGEDPADDVVPPPLYTSYVYGTDFNTYMRQLHAANHRSAERYRNHRRFAYTRMTGGSVLDFVPPGMDVFHSLAFARQRGLSLAGLSERMAEYPFRGKSVKMCHMFFDMDLETKGKVCLEHIEDITAKVLFPSIRKFFELETLDNALHLAIYSPLDKDNQLEPSIKHIDMCGWCKNTSTGPTDFRLLMEGPMPIAECFRCGLRFPRDVQSGDIGEMPVMVSLLHFLRLYNEKHSTNTIESLVPLPAWTKVKLVGDDDVDEEEHAIYDQFSHVMSFHVNTRRLEVQLSEPNDHFSRTKRKYSIHIKALHNTHATHREATKHNFIAKKRYQAYCKKVHHDVGSDKKHLREFVEYEYRKRRRLNAQESEVQSRLMAERSTVTGFGVPMHVLDAQDITMYTYFLSRRHLLNLPLTQQIFLLFMSYLTTATTKYQQALDEDHPLKEVDILEIFDAKPAINGAALRLCFDQLNEHKPLRCKCPDVAPDARRKRGATKNRLSSPECMHCQGRGFYLDTSRNPTRLLKILVDPHHGRHAELQGQVDAFLSRMHHSQHLAMLLALTSTRVHMGVVEPRYKVTPAIDVCMRNVPTDIIYRKRTSRPSGPALTNPKVLRVVQEYVRNVALHRVLQWKDLSVQSLSPWNAQKFPRYRANVHETCTGCQWCPYGPKKHRSNTIYFVLVPPPCHAGNSGVGTIYAACWSTKCKGCWRGTPMRDKLKWSMTKEDTAAIWPRIYRETFVPIPSTANAEDVIREMVGSRNITRTDPPSRGVAPPNVVVHQDLSLRSKLRAARRRRFVASLEFVRYEKDEEDAPIDIHNAFCALNLIGS